MIKLLLFGLFLFTNAEMCCNLVEGIAEINSSNRNGVGDNLPSIYDGVAGPADKFDLKAAPGTAANRDSIYRLTCYTCVNVSNNKVCNEWAIDTPCPTVGQDFCKSLHILDSRGESVLVKKSCVSEIDCHPRSVGCMPMDTQRVCISCCDTSYCNVESPTNATNAAYTRKRRPQFKKNVSSENGSVAIDSSSTKILFQVWTIVVILVDTLVSVFLYHAYH